MIRYAQYRGKSAISKAIRVITRSRWSHTALLFDREYHGVDSQGNPVNIFPGMVVEAWADGIFDRGAVRVTTSLSAQHSPRTTVDLYEFVTPLTEQQFECMAKFACAQIGKPYDWWHVLLFVPVLYLLLFFKLVHVRKTAIYFVKKWFCSFLGFAAALAAGIKLLEETEAWEVAPRDVPRSPLLRLQTTLKTS